MAVLADQDQLPLGVHRDDGDGGAVVDPALSDDPAVGQADVALEDVKDSAAVYQGAVEFVCLHAIGGFRQLVFMMDRRCCSIVSFGRAPTRVLTRLPSLNNSIVGMLRTL